MTVTPVMNTKKSGGAWISPSHTVDSRTRLR